MNDNLFSLMQEVLKGIKDEYQDAYLDYTIEAASYDVEIGRSPEVRDEIFYIDNFYTSHLVKDQLTYLTNVFGDFEAMGWTLE